MPKKIYSSDNQLNLLEGLGIDSIENTLPKQLTELSETRQIPPFLAFNLKYNNHAAAVHTSIKKMDAEFIDDLLQIPQFLDADRKELINKLKNNFKKFEDAGDTALRSVYRNCRACHGCNKYAFTFIGNHSHNYFCFIFEIENYKVKYLYECGYEIAEPKRDRLNKRIPVSYINPMWKKLL